ncbi:hypothetical protein B0T26DRAFT_752517 [Lasiosphaeria miniovina]|uniref:Uncharacterized protein n=1 Tax=Lasiosphaeria miniovina TaxID=1954250 RepID=A0AA40AMI6_9PEZI|nr:uncharacterized protein B0T26DRAFT_752517 [Lasiosphaeria miniovina]KAK0718613.1 hypothetical protein B0T26DRAFT_752517 [Lasiosphaeria miniovina]
MADNQPPEDFFGKTTPIQFLVGGTVVLLVSLLLNISPAQDPAEPPLIKPRMPVIGHFWGLFRGYAAYFTRLYERT